MEPVTMATAAAVAAPAAAGGGGVSALGSFLEGASSAAPAAGGAEALAAPENIVGDSAAMLPGGDGVAGISQGGEITDATSAEFEAAEVSGTDTMNNGVEGIDKGKSDFSTRFKEGWNSGRNSGKSSGGEAPPMVDNSHPTNHIPHVQDAGSLLAQLQRH